MLYAIAEGLLDLLTSRRSVALNRAAIGSSQLSALLLSAGRTRTGDAMVRYLARLHERGMVSAPDAEEAFSLFFGLVVRDCQIQTLLGARRPSRARHSAQAKNGVDLFLALTSTPTLSGGAGGARTRDPGIMSDPDVPLTRTYCTAIARRVQQGRVQGRVLAISGHTLTPIGTGSRHSSSIPLGPRNGI